LLKISWVNIIWLNYFKTYYLMNILFNLEQKPKCNTLTDFTNLNATKIGLTHNFKH